MDCFLVSDNTRRNHASWEPLAKGRQALEDVQNIGNISSNMDWLPGGAAVDLSSWALPLGFRTWTL